MNNILFMKAKTYTLGVCLLLLTFVACKEKENTIAINSTKQEN